MGAAWDESGGDVEVEGCGGLKGEGGGVLGSGWTVGGGVAVGFMGIDSHRGCK